MTMCEIKFAPRLTLIALLSGFLTVTCTGIKHVNTNQTVLVKTPGAAGSSCALNNTKGSWQIDKTPGTAEIARSPDSLHILCTKIGFTAGAATVEPKANGMPWQNIVSGGFFGQRANDASDTAYEYPVLVSVQLERDTRTLVVSIPAPEPSSLPAETALPLSSEETQRAEANNQAIPNIAEAALKVSKPKFFDQKVAGFKAAVLRHSQSVGHARRAT
ncbi:MAG TPA: hypothetical protein EYQ81_02920 [Sneathiellales bacterium]|nr:hypothetical protein [Sneathiellales bacterium]